MIKVIRQITLLSGKALKIQKLLAEPYNITNIYNNIGVTLMDHCDYDQD